MVGFRGERPSSWSITVEVTLQETLGQKLSETPGRQRWDWPWERERTS